MTTPATNPGVCLVCLRQHDNIGYAPSPGKPTGWACMACLNAAPGIAVVKGVYHMQQQRLNAYEEKAIAAGGEKAGEYLDSINKTDITELELHEWLEIGRRWLTGYADSMSEMMTNDVAPF